VSPKDKRQLAREHLDDAEAAVSEDRLKDAVNALFYAAEAATVAVAERSGIDTRRQHQLKADAASEMHQKGVLKRDYGPLLRTLNQARKDIWYEGDDPKLEATWMTSSLMLRSWSRQLRRANEPADFLGPALGRRVAAPAGDDRDRAERYQTKVQRLITAAVVERSLALGASAVALTGSTARRRRTAISDLDYHVIGRRPDVSDLPAEVDIVATAAERFRDRLLEGDDFAQWTLRFGCVLYDAGPMRDGVRLILEANLWPDAQRKFNGLAGQSSGARASCSDGRRRRGW